MKKKRGPLETELRRTIAKLNDAERAAPGRIAVLNVASKLIDLATLLVVIESERFRAEHPAKGRKR
jgi:hypothetical protein